MPAPDTQLHVAGIQLEFPKDQQAAAALDHLAATHPEAQILVLSEYTFLGPVPQVVRDIVKKHHRYLIAGGMKLLPGGSFYDTAFVIGPDGQDAFEQAKSVPVQCTDDGLPATQRRVWNSPWGKIGIAVCYDLGYARVMDDFVRQGAQGLIIPTMDVTHWGEYERRMLHGRVAPIRSAEYAIPAFGVWSSGVSQLTDPSGHVLATARYPGQGEMISGPFPLNHPGRIPPDRPLAITSTAVTGIFLTWLMLRMRSKPPPRFHPRPICGLPQERWAFEFQLRLASQGSGLVLPHALCQPPCFVAEPPLMHSASGLAFCGRGSPQSPIMRKLR